VPGQQTEVSEYIRGFAWAREVAPGQALLATVNDVKEVAIISVQSVFVADEDGAKGDTSVRAESRESVVWLVREIARFKAQGPHEAVEVRCPLLYWVSGRSLTFITRPGIWTSSLTVLPSA
jgi:hypothetical protein